MQKGYARHHLVRRSRALKLLFLLGALFFHFSLHSYSGFAEEPKAVRLTLPLGTFQGQELSLEHTVYYFNDREETQVVSAKLHELISESTEAIDSIEFLAIQTDHAQESDTLQAVNTLAQENSMARQWTQMARIQEHELPVEVREQFSSLSDRASLFVGTVGRKTMEQISLHGTPIINAQRSYSQRLNRSLTLSRFIMGGTAIHLTLVYGEGLPHWAVLPITLAAAYSELKVFQYYSVLFPWYAHRPVLRRPVHGDPSSGFVGSLLKQWSVSFACWSFITAFWTGYGLSYEHFLRDWVGSGVPSVFPRETLNWDFIMQWSFLSSLRSTFAMGGWRMVLSWWEADNIRLNPSRRGRYEVIRDSSLVGFGTLTLGLVVLSALEVDFSKLGVWVLGSTGWASAVGFKVFRKQINQMKLWGLEHFRRKRDASYKNACERSFHNASPPPTDKNTHVSYFIFPKSVAMATA